MQKRLTRLTVVIGFVLAAYTLAQDGAAVKVTDQSVTDGAVTVASVTAEQDGFIVIHRANADGSGPQVPASTGHAQVSRGENNNVTVTLDESVAAGDTLYAMFHVDTNGNGVYEFGPGSTDVDTPAVQGGSVVVVPFKVEGSSRAAPGTSLGASVVQAPALPGAGGPISAQDRVYTADQSSNTVSVINPATNEVLGTIPLGEARLDGVLGPVDTNQVNVHGLGFSRDGRFIDVVDVTSNAVQVIDAATNEVVTTAYTGRSPHEAFISPDGSEVWAAVRGEDYVAVLDRKTGETLARIQTADGPSKVVFSPDGETAYVNHVRSNDYVAIDVASREVTKRLTVPDEAGGSSDQMVTPDGAQAWLGHPGSGKTTVIDLQTFTVATVLDTGPRTNHPNFVSTADGDFAYVTVGDLNQTKVYRRGEGVPELVATIEHTGVAPHGIWPSPDNTRVYVALQKSDAVDVIDTATNKVINTLSIGQDPQALIYVAGAAGQGDGAANLSQQGLGKRVENFKLELSGVAEVAYSNVGVRDVGLLDEIDVRVRGLPANETFTVYASDGSTNVPILDITSDDGGAVGEALAFTKFFGTFDRFILTPQGQQP